MRFNIRYKQKKGILMIGITFRAKAGSNQSNSLLTPKNIEQEFERVNNVINFCNQFENDKFTPEKFLAVTKKDKTFPLLSGENLKKITDKIYKLAAFFSEDGLTVNNILDIGLRHLSIFKTAPEKFLSNINGIVEDLQTEGLDRKGWIDAVKKFPHLMSNTPETTHKNIHEIQKAFEADGLTVPMIIESAKTNPMIYAAAPSSTISKVKHWQEIFIKGGDTPLNALHKALSNSSTIYTNEEKTKNTTQTLLERYKDEGLTEERLATLYKKQAGIVGQNPQSTIDKIELLKYIELNKINDLKLEVPTQEVLLENVLKKSLTTSKETMSLMYLGSRLSKEIGEVIHQRNIKNDMIDFIKKYSNRNFHIKIVDGEKSKEFANIIEEFTKKQIDKNIFKLHV
jgi:hypothetical protein